MKRKVILPDGKPMSVEEVEFREFVPLYYSHLQMIWRQPKEVQTEVLNALLVYGFTGNKLKVSETAEMLFEAFLPTLRSSRTHARNRKGRTGEVKQKTAEESVEIQPENEPKIEEKPVQISYLNDFDNGEDLPF